MKTPTRLDHVIHLYLDTFSFLLVIGQGSRPLLPIGWIQFQILRHQFWSLTNPTLQLKDTRNKRITLGH
jgi:hypothetical protein